MIEVIIWGLAIILGVPVALFLLGCLIIGVQIVFAVIKNPMGP